MSGGDDFAGEVPERLDAAEVRRLSELRPAVSAAHVVLEWTAIVAAGVLCWRFFHPALYALTVVFIGARQHALMVLAHDGAHYRLFRNRALNDWVSELVLAWPFIVLSMHAYRRNHFPHHRNVNTPLDPDWVRKQTPDWKFPRRPAELARLLLMMATGVGFLRFILTASRMPRAKGDDALADERWFRVLRLPYLLGLGAAIYFAGLGIPFLLFWIVPFVTWTQLAFHIRSIAEHFAIAPRPGVFGQTRTVLAGALDRLFLVPKNVGYHLEHHLYPSVPFYRLPELHALLMQRPGYRAQAAVTRGYWNVLRECVREG